MVEMLAFCILPASRISYALSGCSRSFSSSAALIRSRISCAAASVKVMITISDSFTGSTGSMIREITCCTSTAVLPEPAAAATSRSPAV